jgi:hypothetical protein
VQKKRRTRKKRKIRGKGRELYGEDEILGQG